jgi:Domain of unknown function (DUF4328)/Protein of unknown function (DUF2510)
VWCPQCGSEYREGFTHCSACDRDLVDARPLRESPNLWADDLAVVQKWRPTEALKTVVIVLLGAVALLTLAEIVVVAHRLSILSGLEHGTVSLSSADAADNQVRAVAGVRFLAVAATAVAFIFWQWRTAKNALSLRRYCARYTPGWSIGGWFIPFANLVIPYRVMQELWSSSDPHSSSTDWDEQPRSRLISLWWTTFLASAFITRIYSATHAGGTATISSVRTSNQITLIGLTLYVVAAIIAMRVVQQLTSRQSALRVAMRASPTTPAALGAWEPPVSGWYVDPVGHFDLRYWDGTQWTEHVSREGLPAIDHLNVPLPGGGPAGRDI